MTRCLVVCFIAGWFGSAFEMVCSAFASTRVYFLTLRLHMDSCIGGLFSNFEALGCGVNEGALFGYPFFERRTLIPRL